MKKENIDKETAKVRSLMERMEKLMPLNEAMDLESRILEESTRVNSDSFLEFLTKYNINKGPFVYLAYIQLYETNAQYPSDDLYNRMSGFRGDYKDGSTGLAKFDNYMDKVSNSEWLNPTGKPYKGQKSMGTKLYPYVIKLTRYTLHWQSEKDFGSRIAQANEKLKGLTTNMSDNLKSILKLDKAPSNVDYDSMPRYRKVGPLGNYEIATFADSNGNPVKQEYFTDPDDSNSSVQYDRTAIRNFLSDIKAQRPVYFGVNEDGSIDEVPKGIGQILYNKKSSHDSMLAQISDPNEIAMAKEYFKQLDSNAMATKQFLLQNVAYICGSVCENGVVGKKSVYWVNKKPLFLLKKTKTKARPEFKYLFKDINNDQLENILDQFAKEDSDDIEALANNNVQGQTMYSTLQP